ncbi:MAG: tetratricopeptide repeat protein [bacterium]
MELIQQGKELAQEGNYSEALKVFKKALEKTPKDPDLLFFLGTCHSSLGDFPVAKYYYQEALKIDPNHSRTRMVWDSMDEVEARPPSGVKSSPPPEPEADAPETEPSAPLSQESHEEDTTREPSDPWSAAFPDTMLKPRSKKGLGILLWVLIALAVAALVYFKLGPQLFQQ